MDPYKRVHVTRLTKANWRNSFFGLRHRMFVQGRSKLTTPSRPRGGATSTSQGHPYKIFRRALERDNLVLAEVTAREIGRVTIAEALELTV